MSLELQVLRTAKAAVDEGLMGPDDYDRVKSAFMKALSIKGGVDSGFLTQGDMAEARKEFFQAAGMGGIAGGANGGAIGGQQQPAQAIATPPAREPAPPSNGNAEQDRSFGNVSTRGATARSRAPTQIAVPEKATSPSSAGARTPSSTVGTPARKSNVGTPSAISSRGGGAAAVADKYRWVMFKIGGGGKEVVIEAAADPSSSWGNFIATAPSAECRYGVFDFEYVNSEGVTFGKLVFLSWAPDAAATKAKMQHASTKDLFRGLLEGVSVELHATDAADLAEEIVRDRVASTVARK